MMILSLKLNNLVSIVKSKSLNNLACNWQIKKIQPTPNLILSALGGVKLTLTFLEQLSQPNGQAKVAEIFWIFLSICWLKIWPKKIEFF